MSGKLSAEQLTKFTLYAEWLILSTWWIGDNWSSLMQSVGASEKVFRLMDLLPSKHLTSKGKAVECMLMSSLESLFFDTLIVRLSLLK
jgi:ATP-binding cassette subfamily B (MDR/TAP) protein 9